MTDDINNLARDTLSLYLSIKNDIEKDKLFSAIFFSFKKGLFI